MLNYIKAELWKALHRRITWAAVLLFALCTGLFGLLMSSADYAELVSGTSTTMLTGILAAPLVAQVVDGNRGNTLKNEVSFGLSRGRIYGGKLIAGLLLGLLLCVALIAGLLMACFPLMPHKSPEEDRTALMVLTFCMLGAVPLWCGMFAFCHGMAMAVPSAAVWVTIYYLLLFVGQPVLVALSTLFTGGLSPLVQAILMPYTLLVPPYLTGRLTWEYQLWCWGIGLGWGVVSTALSGLYFYCREIR